MKLKPFSRFAAIVSVLTIISGCAGQGGAIGPATTVVMDSELQTGELDAIIHNMAASVGNGQIASRSAPADQQFRLQRLAGAIRSNSFQQEQRWDNPKTGNAIVLKPLGQQIVDPYTRQNCRALEEVLIPSNGRKIRENRRACQDLHTGQWNMVQ